MKTNINDFEKEKELLKLDFEKIDEDEIEDYTGEPDTLKDYEKEDIETFAYLDEYDFCIIELNKNDGVYRYIDGSSNFIVKINDQLYIGTWNECEYDLNDESDREWASNLKIFSEFENEMKKRGLSIFYMTPF